MATLTVNTISRAGADPTGVATSAAGGGDKWANTGSEFLWIKNGDSNPMTLTLTLPASATVDGQAPSSRTVAVAAGATKVIGPFPTNIYNDTSGNMNVAYSAVTSLTVAVFKLVPAG